MPTAAFHSNCATFFPSSIPFTLSDFPVGTNSRRAASPPVENVLGDEWRGSRGRGRRSPLSKGSLLPSPDLLPPPHNTNSDSSMIFFAGGRPEESAVRGLAGAGQINLVGSRRACRGACSSWCRCGRRGQSASSMSSVTKTTVRFFLHPDALGFLFHEQTGLGVELAEGLVEEHDLGAVAVGPGDAHALLHAAGKLMRVMLLEAVEPHHVNVLLAEAAALLSGQVADAGADLDVAAHRAPREQHVLTGTRTPCRARGPRFPCHP